ncbi:uncharacterized protein TNCV_2091041 [Trichonephila clavipes]|nr:uncharacterized protein TNCV_2091041 [Trichonephila clavipes]
MQHLLSENLDSRQIMLRFLKRVDLQDKWPWNILWIVEARFHLEGAVSIKNCHICAGSNPHQFLQIPLHSSHVAAGCGFTATCIVGSFFFENHSTTGLVTCTVTGQRYASLLEQCVIPTYHARRCNTTILFIHNGVPPHIARCLKHVLRCHFDDYRFINQHFSTAWPRSPDLNPCDFYVRGYLKTRVFYVRGYL